MSSFKIKSLFIFVVATVLELEKLHEMISSFEYIIRGTVVLVCALQSLIFGSRKKNSLILPARTRFHIINVLMELVTDTRKVSPGMAEINTETGYTFSGKFPLDIKGIEGKGRT